MVDAAADPTVKGQIVALPGVNGHGVPMLAQLHHMAYIFEPYRLFERQVAMQVKEPFFFVGEHGAGLSLNNHRELPSICRPGPETVR